MFPHLFFVLKKWHWIYCSTMFMKTWGVLKCSHKCFFLHFILLKNLACVTMVGRHVGKWNLLESIIQICEVFFKANISSHLIFSKYNSSVRPGNKIPDIIPHTLHKPDISADYKWPFHHPTRIDTPYHYPFSVIKKSQNAHIKPSTNL